ncbi:MAG: type II toxin-antitoxin system VapC family toxin [Candidatus Natronoplasma sp.]
MYYFDSNVFILPALYEGDRSREAAEWLKKMVKGEIEVGTSVLTLDEVSWILSHEAGREEALKEGERILELPHLKILDVKSEDTVRMINYLRRYEELKPRDAIHLSVAVRNGIHTIVSDDDDFDGVKEIEWVGLE